MLDSRKKKCSCLLLMLCFPFSFAALPYFFSIFSFQRERVYLHFILWWIRNTERKSIFTFSFVMNKKMREPILPFTETLIYTRWIDLQEHRRFVMHKIWDCHSFCSIRKELIYGLYVSYQKMLLKFCTDGWPVKPALQLSESLPEIPQHDLLTKLLGIL